MRNLFFVRIRLEQHFQFSWLVLTSEWICQETMRSDNGKRTIFAYNIVVVHVLSDIFKVF